MAKNFLSKQQYSTYQQNLDIAYFQRHLGRSYNVFCKMLNSNAYNDYIKFVKKYAGERVAEKIQVLIVNFDYQFKWESEFIKPEISDMFKWIYPLESTYWGKDQFEESELEQKKAFAIEIAQIIYNIMPDGVDAILLELKNELPIINVIHQLHLLKLAYLYINGTHNGSEELRHFIGYTDYTINLKEEQENFFAVITMVSIIDDYVKSNEKELHISIAVEDHLYKFIKQLENFCYKKLRPEHNQFIITKLSAYLLIYKDNISRIRQNIRASFNYLLSIRKNQVDQFMNLGYSGKRKLIEAIPFCISSKVESILSILLFQIKSHNENDTSAIETNNVDDFLDSLQKEFIKFIEISEKRSIINLHPLDHTKKLFNDFVNVSKNKSKGEYYLSIIVPIAKQNIVGEPIDVLIIKSNPFPIPFTCFKDKFRIAEITIGKLNAQKLNEQLWINLQGTDKNIMLTNSKLIEKMNIELNYYFNKTKRDNHSRMMHRGNIFSDVIKSRFENDDMFSREKKYHILVKNALQLVMASYSFYLNFDSISNQLEIRKPFITAYCLRKIISEDIAIQIEFNSFIEDKLSSLLKEWANNLSKRQASSAYICLDNAYPIWKYNQKEGYGNQRGYGVYFADSTINSLNGMNTDDIGEKDRIVVPVICHNRIMGVLYLASIIPDQFACIDRIRLINFVSTFSIEIFKSKLLNTIKSFERLYEQAISHPHEQQFFCDKLANETAKLFSAAGSLIIWKAPGSAKYFKVLGRSGKEIEGHFGIDEFLNIGNELFKRIRINKQSDFVDFHQLNDDPGKILHKNFGFQSCIQIPIITDNNSLDGIIILFDKIKINTLSKPLEAELSLIAQELKQVISNYFDHEGRIKTLHNMMGHDINTSLLAINNRKEELLKLVAFLPEKVKYNYNLKLKDISTHTQTARAMVDFLTNDDFKIEHQVSQMHEYIRIYTDKLKLLWKNKSEQNTSATQKSNFDYLINNILQSYKSRFEARKIMFKKTKIEIPPLWINYPILESVLNNLIDNVSKYGEYNSVYNITWEYSQFGEWIIDFSSNGIPLRDEAKEDVEIIFAKDTRCFKTNLNDSRTKVRGKGIGMFTAREYITNYGCSLELYSYEELTEFAQYVFRLRIPSFLGLSANPWIYS